MGKGSENIFSFFFFSFMTACFVTVLNIFGLGIKGRKQLEEAFGVHTLYGAAGVMVLGYWYDDLALKFLCTV